MDYVVAGFGIGAILALIGFALWELFGNVEESGRGWSSRAAIGLMLGALVIWAVTGVSLISHIEDSMGSQLVLVTTLVTLVAVAGGTFWYWRADRALAAATPRPARASAQRDVDPSAAVPAATGDFELTEWDSWPERDAGEPSASEGEPVDSAPAPAPSFEPEVAVAAPVVDEAPGIEAVEAVAVEVAESLSEDEEPKEPAEAATDNAESEVELPSNVRPFRAPAKPTEEPAEQVIVDDVPIAEAVDIARVDVPKEEDATAIVVEEAEIVAVVEDEQPTIVDVPDTDVVDEIERPIVEPDEEPKEEAAVANGSDLPRAGFESSLLADIDGSLIEDDEGYRSPLLSDLGSDKLEGVGLAKWRPDARLTDEDEEELPPPAKSGRRR